MRITVNGQDFEVAADQDTPLLYVLRNDLGLKASRFGCGTGLCGACLVLLDGHPTPSCDTPLWAVAGKQVTKVEGLRAHPVLVALLARTPNPDESHIQVAMFCIRVGVSHAPVVVVPITSPHHPDAALVG